MGEFKLSAVLAAHTSDVRAVALPSSDLAITASRDGTTKSWKKTSASPPQYEPNELSHGAAYKTCVAFLPPMTDFSQGLILSGGQDTIIEARQPGSIAEQNADGLMVGHSHQISSLDVNAEDGWIVSGSWDGTAKLWRVGRWEPEVDFPGHEGTVWAVLAYNHEVIVTGCADQGIRVFDTRAKIMAQFSAKDVCRALAKVPEHHSTGGQLLSATNDGVIRIWDLKGRLISELHGHEAFIYSLAVLPDGRFVSSGEDRTLKIWHDTSCVQTITLPAVSVWSVGTSQTGDIIAGSSDKMARIFSSDPERLAAPEAQAEFEEAVRSSSIPQETVGTVNKTDMVGPEFLQQKSGTKDGQVQMIKEGDGSVSAYSWSSTKQTWEMVGTVVDSAGGGQKVSYQGKEYDYVFDVDIEDGKPPLKLPFNVTQNPHDVAYQWLQNNGLPLTYLDQTVNFIRKNTQGATLGQVSSTANGPDPFGTESRYRSDGGSNGFASKSNASGHSGKLPQREYISIAAGKPDVTHQQILKLNKSYQQSGSTHTLSREELESLSRTTQQLQTHSFNGGEFLSDMQSLEASVPVCLRIATEWEPLASRLAGLDMLRFLAAAAPRLPSLQTSPANKSDIVEIVINSGIFDPDVLSMTVKPAMVAMRFFANLMFASKQGRESVDLHADVISTHVKKLILYCGKDSSLAVAVTTYQLNMAVWLTRPQSDKESTDRSSREERALFIIETISGIFADLPALPATTNSSSASQQATEPVFRGLFAVGTILAGMRDDQIAGPKHAARDIFDFPNLLSALRQRGYLAEARFRGLVEEVEAMLS